MSKEIHIVTHYKIDGHLACGTHGERLASSKELNQVKCRNCRNTEVYKQARRDTRNAARRAARKAKGAAAYRLAHFLAAAPDRPARPQSPATGFCRTSLRVTATRA